MVPLQTDVEELILNWAKTTKTVCVYTHWQPHHNMAIECFDGPVTFISFQDCAGIASEIANCILRMKCNTIELTDAEVDETNGSFDTIHCTANSYLTVTISNFTGEPISFDELEQELKRALATRGVCYEC